ncbi:MAG TPA: hypothetical protein VH538_05280 [Gaiellaceae bacterium]
MSRLRLTTPLPVLAVLAAAALAAVAVLAVRRPHGGTTAVVVALVLAPVAIWSVLAISERLAGRRFAVAAGIVYVVLPFAARLFFYGPFVSVYDRVVAPALVGLRAPAWFALGVALALTVALAPTMVTGTAGAIALLVALIAWVDTDWTTLYDNFHESAWSPTLLSLLPFACTLAVLLRKPWLGAAIGGWAWFFILHGVQRPYTTGAFWLSLGAATPAAAVLLTSLALLVPRLGALKEPAAPPGSPSEAR